MIPEKMTLVWDVASVISREICYAFFSESHEKLAEKWQRKNDYNSVARIWVDREGSRGLWHGSSNVKVDISGNRNGNMHTRGGHDQISPASKSRHGTAVSPANGVFLLLEHLA
jgi:hypothetical protein